jgi:very-short-patch-repair endonuclease
MPRGSRGKSSRVIVHTARDLRRQLTPTEEKLWNALRGRGVGGLKFRRQHPYGRYVLDFFCVERQLALEVDGGVHLQPGQAEHDAERSAFLAEQGICVLRFKNEEIERDLEGVLKRIMEAK